MPNKDDIENRRWFQFRLRTLLAAFLILSLPLSWFAVKIQKAQRQKEAVASLDALVLYEWQVHNPSSPTQKQPPEWLWQLLGDDFFFAVTHVEIFPKASNRDLRIVADLEGVRWLLIQGSEITDEGLECLSGLRHLETLHLIDAEVTEKGKRHLQEALLDCEIVLHSGETIGTSADPWPAISLNPNAFSRGETVKMLDP